MAFRICCTISYRKCSTSSRSAEQSFRQKKNRAAEPGFPLKPLAVGLLHDHLRADFGTVIEIDDVLIQEANAARGHGLPDRPPFRRAMQTVARIAAFVEKIERTGAKRIG